MPVTHRIFLMHRFGPSHTVAVVLLGLAVLVGACLVVRWLWTSEAEPTKDLRGRLRGLAWCAALIALCISVTGTVYRWRWPYNWPLWMVVPIATAGIIIFWPRFAARIVPPALILLGLAGFVIARDYASGGPVQSYGVTPVGNPGIQADLILPQAYALLLLGGWLILRSADPVLAGLRQRLGVVARAPLGDQLRTLALLPVVAVLAGVLAPRLWLAGGASLVVTLALLCGVLLVIRRRPVRAAQFATAGLLCLGILGLAIAAVWDSEAVSWLVVAPASAKTAAAPSPLKLGSAVASVTPGAPAAVPSPATKRPPGVPSSVRRKPPRVLPGPRVTLVTGRSAVKPSALSGPDRLESFVVGPAFETASTGADVADVIWGQPIPFGAVLVADQHTADAAAVEGLAFLALGTWLAPQVFPRVRRMFGGGPDAELSRRVERLTQSRAVAVDTASAELRRLERDLHDGAQARLVAVGMSLRAAERLIPTSPDAALALVAEAREASVKALTELRELVRGVLPPVLADRGLADAVRALALDSPLHVQTEIDLPGRPPAPVETACYFAVAELLTNAAKHSGARDARVTMGHSGRLLRIEVTDFGLGGADPGQGSGLAGVEKRLATFDGILAVSSPAGGPTIVVLEVRCVLSSPRTSSC